MNFILITIMRGYYTIYLVLKLYVTPTLTPHSSIRNGYLSDEKVSKACVFA